ncbi:MAG: MFS transporter [Bryobacterales bacterium]|nr:MFS transporter [Bryobacterales bacterium]
MKSVGFRSSANLEGKLHFDPRMATTTIDPASGATAETSATGQPGSYWQLLRNGGFTAFLWTQFLGAFNDNLYKITVSLLTVMLIADQQQTTNYLAAAGFLFVLPFVLFSGYAGQLADRYNKRRVLIVTKLLEIPAMLLGLWAFLANDPLWMLAVVFVLALQATFFSPAKYGILPEMLPLRDMARANGLLEMTTFVAIILGTTVAGFLFEAWSATLSRISAVTIAIAVLGSLCSFGISRVRTPQVPETFSWNPAREVWRGASEMLRDRVLLLSITGISFFWFLGTLLQMDLLLFAKNTMHMSESGAGILIAGLAVGIAVGSLLAGRISGDHIEIGLVAPGCFGMGLSALAVVWAAPSFPLTLTALMFLGMFGGFFIVPLNALLQHHPAEEEKGRALGTNNFFNGVAMLMAAVVFWVLTNRIEWSGAHVIFAAGCFTVASTLIVLWFTPEPTSRYLLTLLVRGIYRFQIRGASHVPANGAALLVANHVSFVDGFLIGACLPRLARFLIMDTWYNRFRLVLKPIGAIPVPLGGRRAVLESIASARRALEAGELVCIFPEGSITRTGNMQRFQRGMEKIVEGLNVPVIPVHLGGVWGSTFSHAGGSLWRKREKLRRDIQVTFGAPLPSSVKAEEARQQVLEMSADARAREPKINSTLARAFVTSARRHWRRQAMNDATGASLTYGRVLTGAILLARWLRRHRTDEPLIGLLLPSSVGGALANLGVVLSGKAPVNLNFTAGPESVASACDQCEIRTVITSRLFLKRARLDVPPGAVYLEDLTSAFGAVRKFLALLEARLLPQSLLLALLGSSRVQPGDLATIVFSSGSSGTPKGVMLSHRGLLANVDGAGMVFRINSSDVIGGLLPFFHSFGYAYNLWFPLVAGIRVAFHANPLDAKGVGSLVEKNRVSILLATPTFLRNYMRVCSEEQFSSLRLVIAGAEKLPSRLSDEFREKFNLSIFEGYGATEMSPVISVNVPDAEDPVWPQTGNRPGTVGQPLPGCMTKVVDPDSFEPLPSGSQGLLLVGGPSRMIGYWKQPGKTAEVLRGDWYITGDIGTVDPDGFITLTDRLSRFSKIAGEMVPLLRVEEAIRELSGLETVSVVALPDPRKGERLVALHTSADTDGSEINRKMAASSVPRLWIPKAESIHHIEELPMLPTGKLDLQRLKALALELETNRKGREGNDATDDLS